ncbi:outer membrane transport energization protein ExbB [Thiopseudomonas denitrificans]|uniref:Outer membrane transport energization protein ExbB n=2 Tax=Thiopseudomonas denitrificans TaxID=1501432 RepID=A0A4R6U500_9GAMM|nr:outer membrane transport energization protein ExbB [Thiopseudomonas denitrificans]
MKYWAGLMAALWAGMAMAAPVSPSELLERIRQEKASEQQLMQERERQFVQDKAQQQGRHDAARAALRKAEAESAQLKAQFEEQEKLLAEQEQQLKERMGELGELFAVLRQSAGDIAGQWQGSMLNVEKAGRVEQLERFANSRRLPTAENIEQLWLHILDDMSATGQVKTFRAPVIRVGGESQELDVTRVGPFSVAAEQSFLVYHAGESSLRELPRQPGGLSKVQEWKNSQADLAYTLIDPTRGGLLDQLQRHPTFIDRVHQGGLVGYVIMVLGVLGLLLAVWRMAELQLVIGSIGKQMRNLSSPQGNNPLGRVLGVLGPNPQVTDLETLELKLDEAVMQEVPRLERGQGLLKLIAAVAPLLGLLGTVTGMIITFQAITQSGGGDSRLMADGISQALVTTVQGLVVAIPMLFLHSIVLARSKGVIQLLEQQCVGLLALHMSAKDPCESE